VFRAGLSLFGRKSPEGAFDDETCLILGGTSLGRGLTQQDAKGAPRKPNVNQSCAHAPKDAG